MSSSGVNPLRAVWRVCMCCCLLHVICCGALSVFKQKSEYQYLHKGTYMLGLFEGEN